MLDALDAMRRDAEMIGKRSRGFSFSHRGGPGNKVFTDEQLAEYVGKGMAQVDIAKALGVTPPAVCLRLKKLRKGV